jgi:hypothetical protein
VLSARGWCVTRHHVICEFIAFHAARRHPHHGTTQRKTSPKTGRSTSKDGLVSSRFDYEGKLSFGNLAELVVQADITVAALIKRRTLISAPSKPTN